MQNNKCGLKGLGGKVKTPSVFFQLNLKEQALNACINNLQVSLHLFSEVINKAGE